MDLFLMIFSKCDHQICDIFKTYLCDFSNYWFGFEAVNPWFRSAFAVFYQKQTQASVEVRLLDSGFRALLFLQIDESLNEIPPTEFNL